MDAPISVSKSNYTDVLNSVNTQKPLYYNTLLSYTNRPGGFLNGREVRELRALNLLDESDEPRPTFRIVANQTSVWITTYHRTRTDPVCKLPGRWIPRTANITLNKRIAKILLERCAAALSPTSKKNLERVLNGWQPRQRKPRTALQAMYA